MEAVVVVGAGISGLAIAEQLRDLRPLVLERAAVAGGHVRSDVEDGRVLDRGPNGWLNTEPAMTALLDRLNLRARVVGASDAFGTRWIQSGGRMHPAPLGPLPLARSGLLTAPQKLRLLAEPMVPRGLPAQSVGTFAERRLGRAVVDRLVGPMVAGIYGGDPYQLSLEAAFPRMHELEQTHGSLLIGAMRARRSGGGGGPGRLETLQRGSGELTEHLAASLGDRLRCGVEVTDVVRRGDGWEVLTRDGAVRAGAVVLACPAFAQARMLGSTDGALATTLAAIRYAPLSVITTAWPADAWPRRPDGFGVLAARDEPAGGVLGTVFASCVFPHEARPDEILLRTMIGGAVHAAAARDDDAGLLRRCRTALSASFGPERADPHLVRVYRHEHGIPQYTVGHPARLAACRRAEQALPGLFLAGNHLGGIGVKDCVRDAEQVARRVIRYSGS